MQGVKHMRWGLVVGILQARNCMMQQQQVFGLVARMGVKSSAIVTLYQKKHECRTRLLGTCISNALCKKAVTPLTVGEGLQQLGQES